MNRSVFTIALEHPCLPGHFPGDPIVPGVVMLERVIDALTTASGQRVVGIRRCKFAGPLRPGQSCTIEWAPRGDAVGFVCSNARGALARGVLEVTDG